MTRWRVTSVAVRRDGTFDYQTLPLFATKAQTYVEQHQMCMYPLIPTMLGIDADLMEQVLNEMSEYYRYDQTTFSVQLAWMRLFLERNTILKPLEKSKIEERFIVFQELWDKSPTIKKMRTQSYNQGMEKGIEKGIEKGRVETLQRIVVKNVQRHFPELTEFAQKKVLLCKQPDALEQLCLLLQDAPDMQTACQLLESISEQ